MSDRPNADACDKNCLHQPAVVPKSRTSEKLSPMAWSVVGLILGVLGGVLSFVALVLLWRGL